MTINNYKEFKVADFLEDTFFRRWVLQQDKSLDFFWKAYFRAYPDQQVVVEEAIALLKITKNHFEDEQKKLPPLNTDFTKNLRESFEANYTPEIKLEVDEEKKSLFKSSLRQLISVAASVAFILCSIHIYSRLSEEKIITEYATGNGEWQQIILPDGSEVALNANSQLSILNDWSKTTDRQVWLKGEAFFKVKKKKVTKAKFTVITKDLKLSVYGTRFNVNTRNHKTGVFLEEGIVTLDLGTEQKQILPGEYIAYSQEEERIVKSYQKKEELHSNWKEGVLKVEDAPMEDILVKIEEIYGIDLIITDKEILKIDGSIAIPVNNLNMALSIIERVLNVQTEKKGKQIFIKQKSQIGIDTTSLTPNTLIDNSKLNKK
ncbi:FecR family protein [Hyunsoonleella sp. 2307UL5-6]|uniref:FecR family protein n=1 Tax=Hyunsoonleella sp. 2307UL5-6 TaxID=3384768 RepID=UPI0039BC4FD4